MPGDKEAILEHTLAHLFVPLSFVYSFMLLIVWLNEPGWGRIVKFCEIQKCCLLSCLHYCRVGYLKPFVNYEDLWK